MKINNFKTSAFALTLGSLIIFAFTFTPTTTRALDCTPGTSTGTCETSCPAGKQGTCGGHKYCVWQPDGNNTETGCICETEGATCSVGGAGTPPPPPKSGAQTGGSIPTGSTNKSTGNPQPSQPSTTTGSCVCTTGDYNCVISCNTKKDNHFSGSGSGGFNIASVGNNTNTYNPTGTLSTTSTTLKVGQEIEITAYGQASEGRSVRDDGIDVWLARIPNPGESSIRYLRIDNCTSNHWSGSENTNNGNWCNMLRTKTSGSKFKWTPTRPGKYSIIMGVYDNKRELTTSQCSSNYLNFPPNSNGYAETGPYVNGMPSRYWRCDKEGKDYLNIVVSDNPVTTPTPTKSTPYGYTISENPIPDSDNRPQFGTEQNPFIFPLSRPFTFSNTNPSNPVKTVFIKVFYTNGAKPENFTKSIIYKHATTVSSSPFLNLEGNTTVKVGDKITVKVTAGSVTEEANLFKASFNYPTNILEVISVKTDESFIKNWVKNDNDPTKGIVNLVGGVPAPGVKIEAGQRQTIAEVIFTAKAVGKGTLKFDSDPAIFRNSDNKNVISQSNDLSVAVFETLPDVTPTPTSAPTTPAPSPELRKGDLNKDGKVNLSDLSVLLSRMGSSDKDADLNGDGKVNIFDYAELVKIIF